MTKFHGVSIIALVGACALASSPALAQETDKDDVELRQTTVMVTGQKRDENLQETAVSADVLSGDLIEDKGVSELYELQYATPSVNISGMGSANVFNIRGIGRSVVDVDVPSGVVIYRDGAPTIAGYFQREPYYDLKSVEVFRGPQGTFVGKSAAGGAVFINTNDADTSGTYGSVEVGAGNFQRYELTAIANLAVNDKVAFRFGYKHDERDTFYDSITGNFTGEPDVVDNNSYRFGATFLPTDNLDINFKLDYHDLDFGGNVPQQYGEKILGDAVQNLFGKEITYTDKSLRAVLKVAYELQNGVTFNSLTSYQDVETRNNLDAGGLGFLSYAEVDVFSQEFNLTSPDDQRLRWIVGGIIDTQDAWVPPWRQNGFIFDLGGPYPFASTFWDKSEESVGVFAHFAYDLTDQLELQIGARYGTYDLEQKTEWLIGPTTVPLDRGQPGVGPFQLASDGGDQQSMNEDSLDGQIALNYTVNPDQFVYGLLSRGHITGGINLFPGIDPPPFRKYDEMQVINLEGGWKATWMQGGFKTQFSAFHQWISDYQANFSEATGLVNNPLNRNASDDSSVYGVEFSGQLRLDDLSVDLGWALLQSELGAFSGVTNPLTGMTVDLTGAKSPFSPEVTGSLGAAYDFHSGPLTITPRFDIAYQSETQAALWLDEEFTLEDRTLVNLKLDIVPDSDNWALAFYMTNATDEHYVAGIQNNATLYYPGAPRQFGARLKFNF